ncbi:hypothetical protein YC2023_034974 [Brassica napus]
MTADLFYEGRIITVGRFYVLQAADIHETVIDARASGMRRDMGRVKLVRSSLIRKFCSTTFCHIIMLFLLDVGDGHASSDHPVSGNASSTLRECIKILCTILFGDIFGFHDWKGLWLGDFCFEAMVGRSTGANQSVYTPNHLNLGRILYVA